jgi:hypothetical protein
MDESEKGQTVDPHKHPDGTACAEEWFSDKDPDPGYVPGSVIPAVVDGQEWAACFGMSWADMLLRDQATSNRIIREGGQYVRRVAGTMGVAGARSEVARYFLEHTDAEWLFMVDSDMGFAADTVDRLVESAEANQVPVLGALCFAQKLDPDLTQNQLYAARYRIQPTLYSYQERPNGERGFQSITKYRRDAYQEVAGTGAACLLVHREALTAVGADPFMPITDPTAGGNGTPRTFSEDLSFCIRVQAAGLTMGVDTSVKTTHYKGGVFLDETTFAMQQETLIQAKGHHIARQAELAARHGLVIPRGSLL